MNKQRKVIIAGAGLAGLTAGLDLQSSGYQVTILESNDFVGGRTASWYKDGMEVESGLHRILGFYTQFPRLVKRAGLTLNKIVVWEDEIEIKIPNGQSGVYGASLLFRPFKTLSGPFRNHIISWKDTWRLSRFFLSGLSAYFLQPSKLDKFSVSEYAKRFGVSDNAITRILEPLTAGIFFLPPSRYSAYVLFGLLAQGVKRFYRTRVGAFKGGMTDVLANPIAKRIDVLGGKIVTNTKVESVSVEHGKLTAIHTRHGTMPCELAVLATSLGPAQRIIRNSKVDHSKFEKLLTLPTMPEINLQLELSKPAWPIDRTVFCPGSPLITFAEQSRTTFTDKTGRLSIILTPPDKFINMSEADIFKVFCNEAKRLGIDPRVVVKYRVISHPGDFYELAPGNEKLRPGTTTAVENLFLAGDYVKQPFLATMEGAIISGQNAAKAVRLRR